MTKFVIAFLLGSDFMPSCRNCHSRLTRFDKDICPVCGCKEPFLGMSTETNEITQEISSINDSNIQYEAKKRNFAVFLSVIGGFFGLPFYYLGFFMSGIIYLLISIICAGAIFLIMYFGGHLDLLISLCVPIGLLFLSNIVLAFVIGLNKNLKDRHREFLK